MLRLFLSLLLVLYASAATAERCRAMVNGSEVVIEADNFATFAEDVKTREKLLNWPSAKWNRAWGTPPACLSGVLYDYLATTVPDNQIDGYCLTQDDKTGFFLVPGERNFRGLCRTTVCQRVNTTKAETVAVTRSIANTAVATVTDPAAAIAVAHKSGAMILSGSAGTLISNIGSTSSTVVTALSTPAALAAVGVSVLAVGGAVYMCSGAEEVLPVAAPVEDVPVLDAPLDQENAPLEDAAD
ncbi:hypothetical protein A8B82_07940 [Sulfitobacter sp. EhC04]|uniref:hypothetical protein n=1 Tax=Sulfitobacter sp. EhC04 TaxID=1849168 RepID=UPI0007F53009|nr:hypothetical protein [Sulfitobacter sp. EhC04]OAN79312.1 hypothetical protein A8B82_07940 [Sulfitobacter sp. EhC04]